MVVCSDEEVVRHGDEAMVVLMPNIAESGYSSTNEMMNVDDQEMMVDEDLSMLTSYPSMECIKNKQFFSSTSIKSSVTDDQTNASLSFHTPMQSSLSSAHVSPLVQYIPLPSGLPLYQVLNETVILEPKYQPALTLNDTPTCRSDITGRMRNGSCHVLRCLKVWYELPSDVFFLAVNTMDRFLTRMKAQPKHLSCIAVSAFHVACEEILPAVSVPSRESVSAISQSKCTHGDVQRMEDIIRSKLDLVKVQRDDTNAIPENNGVITPLSILKLLYECVQHMLSQNYASGSYSLPPLLLLIHKLEVVICDTRCANYRAVELAMALLRKECVAHDSINSVAHIAVLDSLATSICKLNLDFVEQIKLQISEVLDEYDGFVKNKNSTAFHRQRLVWKLSNRTAKLLRPLDKIKRYKKLPSIDEDSTPSTPDSSSCSTPEPSEDIFGFSRVIPGHNSGVVNVLDNSGGECSHIDDSAVDHEQDMGEETDKTPEENTQQEDEEDENMETNEMDDDVIILPSDIIGENAIEDNNNNVEMVNANKDSDCDSRFDSEVAKICGSDREESYSQVAKKRREEIKTMSVGSPPERRISFIANRKNTFQTSPLSKITLTPATTPSTVAKNLTSALEQSSNVSRRTKELDLYSYHHQPIYGIVDFDSIQTREIAPLTSQVVSPSVSTVKNHKRKKFPHKLQLVTRTGNDSEPMSEEPSSSEEDMDSDYEKEFPPLPTPSPPRIALTTTRRKTSIIATTKKASAPVTTKKASSAQTSVSIKKKKKSDASPYGSSKTRVMRKFHARKMMPSKVEQLVM